MKFRISAINLCFAMCIIQARFELSMFTPNFDFRMDVLRINNTDLNSSIINKTHNADDMMECTYKCNDVYHLSVYYFIDEKICHCNIDIDPTAVGVTNSDLLYGFFNYNLTIPIGNQHIQTLPLKFDCLDLYRFGFHGDGVFVINPTGFLHVEAWCDMKNGGWTVFQRRMNGKVDFLRTWAYYKYGFGDKNEEYWLGFEHIHALTHDHSSLIIELGRFGNPSPSNCSAEYSTFVITDEQDNYRIIVDGHSGTCPDLIAGGNSVTIANNSAFSTWDKDNDNDSGNCASGWNGAWWFNACFHTKLMGEYLQANNTYSGYGTLAADFTGFYESLKTTVMKVRRN